MGNERKRELKPHVVTPMLSIWYGDIASVMLRRNGATHLPTNAIPQVTQLYGR